jgi:signal transduction histidine kinase
MPRTKKRRAAKAPAVEKRSRAVPSRTISRQQLSTISTEWRTTVDTAREAIMMVGPDDRLVRANVATQDLFQRPFAQLVGARIDDLARDLLGAPDPLRLARARRSGKPYRGDVRASDRRWFALAVDPIAAPPGTWAGAVCRLRDNSERRRADQLVKRSLRQMRDLAAHLQESREEERSSIADQIHNQLVHDVTALKLDLTWLRSRLAKGGSESAGDGEPVDQRVEAMSALADRCLKTLRRISSELRPDLLLHFGPSEAIEWQAEELRLQTGVRTRLDLSKADLGLSSTIATALYRIVQAALENVARHAEADEVKISLRRRGSNVVVTIADDGRGFDPKKVAPSSFGLIAMRERALSLGGDLAIDSRPKRGTTVTARLPVV